ncbi:hypothetical protein SUF15_09890 [Streptococcus agalactiae]|uniref:hypothetical protein n=1 Tax=Streptococcus agalactiae TaxID=1311 RepID=UPI001374A478|nr:hypothetical protein [Streptococcus agalactiae]KAF1260938.1 hypothetical protein B8V75_04055 [Streptococcus agalactiae]KAF1271411.1 hypothetical protein B8V71_02665 [Streptococcus agalactiae]HEN0543773.1 hypothetical protein [Streptococcus agalactiae]
MKTKLKTIIPEDKKGIQLSSLIFLNWLIKFLSRWSFLILSMICIAGLCGRVAPMSDSINFIYGILFILLLIELSKFKPGREFKSFRKVIELLLLIGFFSSALEQQLSAQLTFKALQTTSIFAIIYMLISFLSPRLLNYYLYKKVLNKSYLGIRKPSDPKISDENIFNDFLIQDINERLEMINQKVVKSDYQEFVKLDELESIEEYYNRIPMYVRLSEPELSYKRSNQILNLRFQLYPLGLKYFGHNMIKLTSNYSAANTYYVSEFYSELRKKFNIK